MSGQVFTLQMLNFGFIGVLPRIFFRKDGRFNPMWWATAAPFFLCPAVLAMGVAGYADALGPASWRTLLEVIATALSVASICLLFLTLGTHRVPIALWHQDNDAPRSIVTHGAYSRIRHPFYTSFILAFAAAFISFPHWGTLLLLVYGVIQLNSTAAREERRLGASEFGADYLLYVTRTGRFWPRPGLRRPARR